MSGCRQLISASDLKRLLTKAELERYERLEMVKAISLQPEEEAVSRLLLLGVEE